MSDRHDPSGWWNVCTRRMPDGQPCGRFYWYAWVASAGRGRRVDGPDSTEPHACREAVAA